VAGKSLGLELQLVEMRESMDLDAAFQIALKGRTEALIVPGDRLAYLMRKRIVDLAALNHLPMVGSYEDMADLGALMTFAGNSIDLFRHAASYVDKILKGAKPGDLPVEQPTKFDLVLNKRTARNLGIKIPQSILVQATKVIE
jgi:putative tryptophan/tyrosine transport system substrate-binding protein